MNQLDQVVLCQCAVGCQESEQREPPQSWWRKQIEHDPWLEEALLVLHDAAGTPLATAKAK